MYLDALDRALGLDSERREEESRCLLFFVSEGLKKKHEPSKFQIFENLRILIVITNKTEDDQSLFQ